MNLEKKKMFLCFNLMKQRINFLKQRIKKAKRLKNLSALIDLIK